MAAVSCPLAALGCNARVKRKDLAAHQADFGAHVSIFAQTHEKATRQAREKATRQACEIEDLKASAKRQSNHISSLEWITKRQFDQISSLEQTMHQQKLSIKRVHSELDEQMSIQICITCDDVATLEKGEVIESENYLIVGRKWTLKAQKQGRDFVLLLSLEEGRGCAVNATFSESNNKYRSVTERLAINEANG